jgi:hypothetical protein
MYFVLAGSGAVEILDHNGFGRVELRPHSALIFSPGTLHRLINPDGNLELLVIMQNSGLPERGDNVVCFTPEWMTGDEQYAEAMQAARLEEAYRRRDRGVEGFLRQKAAFSDGLDSGRAALADFYRLAAQRTAHLQTEWEKVVTGGAQAEALASLERLAALAAGQVDYLHAAQHHLIHAGEYNKPGFCGHLNRYFDPATLAPEGVRTA